MIHHVTADPTPDGLPALATCSCGQTIGTIRYDGRLYHLVNHQRPTRPGVPADATRSLRGPALQWLTNQHLYAHIREEPNMETSTELDAAVQPALPREVLAEMAAADLLSTLLGDIDRAAAQTTPSHRGQALSRVEILAAVAAHSRILLHSQIRNAAINYGYPYSRIADAVGLTRQRVHQIVHQDNRPRTFTD